MSLDRQRDIADLILKWLSILAIGFGGAWAAYTFNIAENTSAIVQLSISSETHLNGADNCLLTVHIKPKNIGKSLVVVDGQRFDTSITKIQIGMSPGVIHTSKIRPYHAENLMARFRGGYELEPGIEYDELINLIVPCGGLYSVRSQLDLGDDSEVDQEAIVVAEVAGSAK